MPRQFLPTLRGLLGPCATEPAPPVETKDLLAGGVYTSMTYAGVTNAWGISEATVKTHLIHLYAKLGVSDRAAAVATAYQRGILG